MQIILKDRILPKETIETFKKDRYITQIVAPLRTYTVCIRTVLWCISLYFMQPLKVRLCDILQFLTVVKQIGNF